MSDRDHGRTPSRGRSDLQSEEMVRRRVWVSPAATGKCSLCGLFASTAAGQIEMRVEFGPAGMYADTGNPLVALNRVSLLCAPCIKAIATWAEEPT
jgi:hypothetical protein